MIDRLTQVSFAGVVVKSYVQDVVWRLLHDVICHVCNVFAVKRKEETAIPENDLRRQSTSKTETSRRRFGERAREATRRRTAFVSLSNTTSRENVTF